jgi:hypothetical protein
MDSRFVQVGIAVTALGPVIFAIGFVGQMDWAADTWPFETSRLTNYFLGSILVAIAAPTMWIAATRRWGSLRTTGLFPFLAFGAMAIYVLAKELSDDISGELLFAAGAACAPGGPGK